jgi:hypothetical protein
MQPPFQNGKTLEFTEAMEKRCGRADLSTSSNASSIVSKPHFKKITDNAARSKT